jgi:hypothetical protein
MISEKRFPNFLKENRLAGYPCSANSIYFLWEYGWINERGQRIRMYKKQNFSLVKKAPFG